MVHVVPPPRIRRILPGFVLTFLPAVLLAGSAPASAGVDRWTPVAPPGGPVSSLLVDPSGPGRLYALREDGLYKTLDGGRHWHRLGNGLPEGEAVHAVLDPSEPGTVYVSLRDPVTVGPRDGLYRSRDAGVTWERRGSLPVAEELAVAAGEPAVLFAAGSVNPDFRTTTVFRSQDAGAAWQAILELPDNPLVFRGLVADPTSTGTVYLVREHGLLKTTDGGDTWTETGPIAGGEPLGLLTLAVAPSAPNVLYLFGNAAYRSDDGGASWRTLTAPPCTARPKVAPRDPDTVYVVCSTHLARSRDGGETWERIDVGPAGSMPALIDLALAPGSPPTGYVATGALGVYKTRDDGVRWVRVSAGIRDLRTSSVAFDPWAPRSLYAITGGVYGPAGEERRWLWRTSDGGATWSRWLPGLVATTEQVVPDPRRPGRVYLATRGGLLRWQEGEGLEQVWSRAVSKLVLDPGDRDRFYAVGDDVLYRSDDAGRTWGESLRFPAGSAFEGHRVHDVVVDPAWPGRVYASVEDWVVGGESGYRLFRSDDAGRSWHQTGSWPGLELYLAPNAAPGAPSVLYTSAFYTYRSTDGGETWDQTSFPGELILALAGAPSTLYARSEEALFRSRDGGVTWNALTGPEDLRIGRYEVLAAHPAAPERLYRYDPRGTLALHELQGVGGRPLLLQGGRFEARAAWHDAEGRFGAARPVPVSDAAGVFVLPGRQRLLAALDVLDTRAADGHFRVVGAAALPMAATVTVMDRATGLSRDFYFPPSPPRSQADSDTFPTLPEPPGTGWPGPAALATTGAPALVATADSCAPSVSSLCFLGGRFRVEVDQQLGEGGTRRAPMARQAPVGPLLWESGLVWFDDPEVPSVVVQLVDGAAQNGSVWVLVGGLSEEAYVVHVWDTETGAARRYVHPAGPPASIADLDAL